MKTFYIQQNPRIDPKFEAELGNYWLDLSKPVNIKNYPVSQDETCFIEFEDRRFMRLAHELAGVLILQKPKMVVVTDGTWFSFLRCQPNFEVLKDDLSFFGGLVDASK